MKKDLTEIIFILDKSGSMHGLEKDTIGGFNSLIDKQKNIEGEAIVSTVLFSDNSTLLHNRIALNEVPLLTSKDYFVSGCTALLDAVGNAIIRTNSIHLELDESDVPEKTMFIITTDGFENASLEFSYSKVKNMIEKCKKKGWEFIFLGANIDSYQEASKLGISEDHTADYCCDASGIEVTYSAIDNAIGNVRKNKKLNSSWKNNINKDLENRKK